jgi:hypothetical protein
MNAAKIASTVITAYEMADPTMKRISREMALIVLDPETDKDDQEMESTGAGSHATKSSMLPLHGFIATNLFDFSSSSWYNFGNPPNTKTGKAFVVTTQERLAIIREACHAIIDITHQYENGPDQDQLDLIGEKLTEIEICVDLEHFKFDAGEHKNAAK